MRGTNLTSDRPLAESPESALELELIKKYLFEKGYLLSDLESLPEQDAKKLMEEACSYASLKLSEIESRNQFRQKIRAPKDES